MIRLVQRRLIIPRGDTGEFEVPVLKFTEGRNVAVFSIIDLRTRSIVFKKEIEVIGESFKIEFTHDDTVNLPVGKYVWDIKIYNNPQYADENLFNGDEVDSYYAGFSLPECEIRPTGDNLLMSDSAPAATLSPKQLDIITAAISQINSASDAAINAWHLLENASANLTIVDKDDPAAVTYENGVFNFEIPRVGLEEEDLNQIIAIQDTLPLSELTKIWINVTQPAPVVVPTQAEMEAALALKADKVSDAVQGNFAALDANGNLVDSGHKHSDYLTEHQDISGKADKTDTLLYTTLSRGRANNSTIGIGSFAFGENVTASVDYAHAEGVSTQATGPYSHAENAATTASGLAAHAEGSVTLASRQAAHAEGYGTVASGDYSHAEGEETSALGEAAHAEGFRTSAGIFTHAEGYYTQAVGAGAHSEGSYTVANHKSQHVFGEYNVADPALTSASNRGNFVEIVGNGTYSTTSNARALDWSGNEYLNGKLYINCDNESESGEEVATVSSIPTSVSQLINDENYITLADITGKIDATEKGAANGVAGLDASGKIPSSQLPSYVDDVLEYANLSSFPVNGESGKIYVALDSNLTYRWSGSSYVVISSALALGETSETAYRGDRGAAAYTHSVTNKGNAFVAGFYKFATNAEGHVIAATPVVKSDITALGVLDSFASDEEIQAIIDNYGQEEEGMVVEAKWFPPEQAGQLPYYLTETSAEDILAAFSSGKNVVVHFEWFENIEYCPANYGISNNCYAQLVIIEDDVVSHNEEYQGLSFTFGCNYSHIGGNILNPATIKDGYVKFDIYVD